ncbi:hypothetical protein AB0L64_06790 [Kribbella sp. NPDC051936]|uniref:hypothetical protein n=1 Tax=Kribbella sp. NPDC051936 TaxID=3154946 RepID=UPI00343D6C75
MSAENTANRSLKALLSKPMPLRSPRCPTLSCGIRTGSWNPRIGSEWWSTTVRVCELPLLSVYDSVCDVFQWCWNATKLQPR